MPDGAAQVQIVMGSKSDARIVMESGITDVFNAALVTYEFGICSAHRNADQLAEFTGEICKSGAEVFIGVAGMAAALPGALAANTRMSKPIIAVPLDQYGIDSCLRMPPGVPVLTAGVGKPGLKNAAIAACQILAVANNEIGLHLTAHLSDTAKFAEFNVNLEEIAS